jgi:hypothetical protein
MKQRALDLIAGTQKHAPNGPLTLGSTSFTAPSLEQTLQSLVDAMTAADAARAAWQDALGKMKTTRANVVPVMQDYAAWVAVTYRSTPSTLADFGVAPRKARTPLTSSEQAVAVAKRVSTRAARNTMGNVQKKAVKGDVTSVTLTPVHAPFFCVLILPSRSSDLSVPPSPSRPPRPYREERRAHCANGLSKRCSRLAS